MKLGYIFWIVIMGIIFLWTAFLLVASCEVIRIVATLIAGWQIGVWAGKLGLYFNGK